LALPLSPFDQFPAFFAFQGFFAILQDPFLCAHSAITFGTENQHIGDMKRAFLLDDASLTGLCRGSGMPFDKIDFFDNHSVFFGKYLKNFSGLPLLLARDYLNNVILPNVKAFIFHLIPLRLLPGSYKTSGAREMIFINFLARNSRATGPNIRVPTGSFCGLINTAEFSSNLI